MSTHLVKLIVLRLFEWLLGPSRLDFLVPHRPFFLRAADPRKPPSKVLAGNAADDVPAGFEALKLQMKQNEAIATFFGFLRVS